MSARRPARIDGRRLERLLDQLGRQRLVVIGDVLLDEYVWGTTDRISPEAPVPVVKIERRSFALGGAGNVASNAVALGASCALAGVVGEDDAGRRVLDLAAEQGIETKGVVVEAGRPTTAKTRILSRGQQMLRVDRETDARIGRAARGRIVDALGRLPVPDGAVLVDYAKGGLPRAFSSRLVARLRALSVPVAVDPKYDASAFRGAALVKPNRGEAARLAGVAEPASADPASLLDRLRRRWPEADWAITDGRRGMTIAPVGEPPVHVPTAVREVFDVQGAGDTTMAALFLARLAGGSLLESALIAHAAAGVVVGKIGTASASIDEVRARLPEIIEAFREGA